MHGGSSPGPLLHVQLAALPNSSLCTACAQVLSMHHDSTVKHTAEGCASQSNPECTWKL